MRFAPPVLAAVALSTSVIAQTRPTAQNLVDLAVARAAKHGKGVLVVFHSPR